MKFIKEFDQFVYEIEVEEGLKQKAKELAARAREKARRMKERAKAKAKRLAIAAKEKAKAAPKKAISTTYRTVNKYG